jgi:hypothetical protein
LRAFAGLKHFEPFPGVFDICYIHTQNFVPRLTFDRSVRFLNLNLLEAASTSYDSGS